MALLVTAGINWTQTVFFIVGGLGIFLYGIRLCGDSLKLLAGQKLKLLIEKTTNTPLKGIFVGIFLTVLLQSSSGTTALVVGLVRAGLMGLPQAVGVILGANIGTTATSFLIGLQIKRIALPIIGVGALLAFFSNKKRQGRFGSALLGFGMIFYGLDLMGGGLKVFVDFDIFRTMMKSVSDWPVLGVLVGAIFTALVQSSTATIGVLQELYTTGQLPLIAGVAIVLGSNVGTTVTAIMAASGGSVAARRTAAAHVVFNLGGSALFLLLIRPYTMWIEFLENALLGGESVAMTISLAHIFFNVFNTFVMFWFIRYLVRLSVKMVPGEDAFDMMKTEALEEKRVKDVPALALENAKRVILKMADIVNRMYGYAVDYSFNDDAKALEEGRQFEEIVDTIDQKVHDYLVKVSIADLDKDLAQLQAVYVDAIRDFERIADHCQNLFDFFEHRHEKKMTLTEDAASDLTHLYNIVGETLNITLEAFAERDKLRAEQVLEYEDAIDALVRRYRKRHVQRLGTKEDAGVDDALFVDILSNVERIGDHCTNIVMNVLQDNYYHSLDEDLTERERKP